MKKLEELGISQTPWRISDSGKTNGCIVDADGVICASGAPSGCPPANSRLIAAAPDMYAALCGLLGFLEDVRESAWWMDARFNEIMKANRVMTNAEAALAKAAGEINN